MRIRSGLLLLASAAIVGCGGGDGGTSPTPENLEGSWTFEVHDLTAPGATGSCALTGSVQLVQDGTSVSGTYVVDRIVCTTPGGTDTTEGQWGGTIVNGSVYGNQVHFHFDTDEMDQHGSVSGDRMSGTCSW